MKPLRSTKQGRTAAGQQLPIDFGHFYVRYARYTTQKLIGSGPREAEMIESRAHWADGHVFPELAPGGATSYPRPAALAAALD